jgi:hypothetical protein
VARGEGVALDVIDGERAVAHIIAAAEVLVGGAGSPVDGVEGLGEIVKRGQRAGFSPKCSPGTRKSVRQLILLRTRSAVGDAGVLDRGLALVEGDLPFDCDPVALAQFEEEWAGLGQELASNLDRAAAGTVGRPQLPWEFEVTAETASLLENIRGAEQPADRGLTGDPAELLPGEFGGIVGGDKGEELLAGELIASAWEGKGWKSHAMNDDFSRGILLIMKTAMAPF